MVIEINRTATSATLQHSLASIRANRAKNRKQNLSEFLGALPHIGDGLEFQNSVRNEWN
ncbi:MAG: hypothetical protein LBN95_09930 [Prevotellaceae bacterium]|jgi:hypothetical protein|nr:hypothetical protein [Prevotellaceae bacterium]